MLFDYYIKLKDKDGDIIVVDPLRDTVAEIKEMAGCSSAEAKKTLALRSKNIKFIQSPVKSCYVKMKM